MAAAVAEAEAEVGAATGVVSNEPPLAQHSDTLGSPATHDGEPHTVLDGY